MTEDYCGETEAKWYERMAEIEAESNARIAELEAEVEELKPYKYGYPMSKKPNIYEWVIVDYEGELEFGSLDDEGIWEITQRDNIRRGIRRWYPLPVLPKENEP